jgi:hypothetical protein
MAQISACVWSFLALFCTISVEQAIVFCGVFSGAVIRAVNLILSPAIWPWTTQAEEPQSAPGLHESV